MKVLFRKYLDSTDADTVHLLIDNDEDTWHLQDLIQVGDIVSGTVTRKVDVGSSGSLKSKTERIPTTVVMRVKSAAYDGDTATLRVAGVTVAENEHVPLGAHQSLTIRLNGTVKVAKPYGWDSIAERALEEALRPPSDGSVAALIFQEGLAHVCLITDVRTHLKAKVTVRIPKKRDAGALRSQAQRVFQQKMLEALAASFDFSRPVPVIVASQVWYATAFKNFVQSQAIRQNSDVYRNIAKGIITTHSSTGYMHGLNEVIRSPEVATALTGLKSAWEMKFVDRYMEVLKKNENRAPYGLKPVEKAIEEGAVGPGQGLLLMNNSLFRCKDPKVRKQYVELADRVRGAGGQIQILSSDHPSGKQLESLGNIAAVLNFPVEYWDPDVEDEIVEVSGGEGEGIVEGGRDGFMGENGDVDDIEFAGIV